jgi:hypothetical protein
VIESLLGRSTDLIAKDEVNATAGCHRDTSRLRVDDRVTVVDEHPVGGDDVDMIVGILGPPGRVPVVQLGVDLAVEQLERLLRASK